jgi:hypothetical protein
VSIRITYIEDTVKKLQRFEFNRLKRLLNNQDELRQRPNYKKLIRDLNVTLQRLKYNLEKVPGCFCKNPGLQRFSEFTELFFYRKSHGICPRDCGPDPRRSAHESMDPEWTHEIRT